MDEELLSFGKRKVCTSNTALRVTLPPEWARTHKVEAGDRIELCLDVSGNLIVKPVKQ
jgi:bifunctional DNA-binding transcriptional regulator/antitoxin component of YhaV-PrlF toxin-antitoxin module